MVGATLPPVHILVTPLGSTVDIIQAPLDKWKPEVIYAFTSMEESIKRVEENLRFAWNINCGPNGPPDVRKVTIEEPWLGHTIQDVMEAFNKVVEDVNKEFPNREIKWHVSVTGGTNLMAIGMAFSATTHLMEVYYTLPGDKHPELRAMPSTLVVDIPLIVEIGPAVNLLRKSTAIVEIYEEFKKSPVPLSASNLAEERDTSESAVYVHLGVMVRRGLIVKVEKSHYSTTTLGDLAYWRWKGNPTS